MTLPIYNAGERVCPPPIRTVESDTASAIQQSKEKNIVWLLSRISAPDVQAICSWTGFNILIRNGIAVVQDSVGCMLTINTPATQISTINKVLNQSLSIMRSLELNTVVCF